MYVFKIPLYENTNTTFYKTQGNAEIYTEIHKFKSFYGNWMQISLLG
jgi:hypothetical protein